MDFERTHGQSTDAPSGEGNNTATPVWLKRAFEIEELYGPKPVVDEAEEIAAKDVRFKFIDLFAGIGGMRIPFEELGGECVFSSEWDKFAQITYARNFGVTPHGDITKISAKTIPDHDVLLAGFPCQAFSLAGLKQGFTDTRGTMFFEIQRVLAEKKPKAFFLENVKQLRGHDNGRTLKTILQILSGDDMPEIPLDVPMSPDARKSMSVRLNYDVTFGVLKATDFGVPQSRERIYIIGFDRDALPNANLGDFFEGLSGRGSADNLGIALEQNDLVAEKYTISDKLLLGLQNRMARHQKQGNGFGHSIFSHESPYCNTITARYYKDGREILIDQSDLGLNPRKLTPRECANIQGFPSSFDVTAVSDAQIYRQFGNSVSVPVIRSLATAIHARLTKGLETVSQETHKRPCTG